MKRSVIKAGVFLLAGLLALQGPFIAFASENNSIKAPPLETTEITHEYEDETISSSSDDKPVSSEDQEGRFEEEVLAVSDLESEALASDSNLHDATSNARQASSTEIILPSCDLKPSQTTIRPGDSLQIKLGDIGFKLDPADGATHYNLEFWTERYFSNRELQSIEIPYVTGKDADGNDLDIDIYFMTLTGGSLWMAEPVRISESNRSHTVYRSEILKSIEDEYENGQWPSKIYLLIQGVPKGMTAPPGETGFDDKDIVELTFHDDIVFNFTVNEEKPYTDQYYDYFQIMPELHRKTAGAFEESKDVYLYYETSDSSIAASKSEDLQPGEELELTFTIDNASEIDNALVFDVDVDGLEIIPGSTDPTIDLSGWQKTENGYQLKLYNLDGSEYVLKRGESVSFTQKFRVADDAPSLIEVKPALNASFVPGERQFDKSITLSLNKNAQEYQFIFDANGGEGDVPVDSTLYAADDDFTAPSTTLERNGYEFFGWNTSADGTGLSINPNQTAVVSTFLTDPEMKTITLYAQWREASPVEIFTVTYTDGVEGEVLFADQVYTVKKDDPTPAFEGIPVRDGFVFKGWSPEPTERVEGNAVYTAQWEKDAPAALGSIPQTGDGNLLSFGLIGLATISATALLALAVRRKMGSRL